MMVVAYRKNWEWDGVVHSFTICYGQNYSLLWYFDLYIAKYGPTLAQTKKFLAVPELQMSLFV